MNKKNNNFENLLGKKFNKLTVMSLNENRDKQNNIMWICKCDCGNYTVVRSYCLKNNSTKSCGCHKKTMFRKENVALIQKFLWYKREAKVRNYEFSLSQSDFFNIIQKPCFYCGDEPKSWSPYVKKDGTLYKKVYDGFINEDYVKTTFVNVTGVDRVDNNQGYTNENSVPCCFVCNMMKKTLGKDEFLNQINKIYNFQKNIKN